MDDPGFPGLPHSARTGFIAFEYADDAGARHFERLSPDMSSGASQAVVAPYPAGARVHGGTVPLSDIADHINAAVRRD
ncbi:hypothetical protein EF294_20120 [Gordonia oryzae]|uniref:Uncharacterized protein n=1 Tax=Gordonia oryzae TaxID=2487349 RepID=A0A3N4G252_9ACTN|nr:hypothetical protein EF294_20120 [Gordonia oryzae]